MWDMLVADVGIGGRCGISIGGRCGMSENIGVRCGISMVKDVG